MTMTINQVKELAKVAGVEVTTEQAKDVIRIGNRTRAILDSINERLVRDHKQHIQVLTHYTDVHGVTTPVFKFLNLDNQKYWDYAEQLLADYCETLMEIKRTKTTLVVIA